MSQLILSECKIQRKMSLPSTAPSSLVIERPCTRLLKAQHNLCNSWSRIRQEKDKLPVSVKSNATQLITKLKPAHWPRMGEGSGEKYSAESVEKSKLFKLTVSYQWKTLRENYAIFSRTLLLFSPTPLLTAGYASSTLNDTNMNFNLTLSQLVPCRITCNLISIYLLGRPDSIVLTIKCTDLWQVTLIMINEFIIVPNKILVLLIPYGLCQLNLFYVVGKGTNSSLGERVGLKSIII